MTMLRQARRRGLGAPAPARAVRAPVEPRPSRAPAARVRAARAAVVRPAAWGAAAARVSLAARRAAAPVRPRAAVRPEPRVLRPGLAGPGRVAAWARVALRPAGASVVVARRPAAAAAW